MNLNLFRRISSAMGRQIASISAVLIRLFKQLLKPLSYLNAYVRKQMEAIFRRPSSKADYIRIGALYISKHFLGVCVTGGILLAAFFTTTVYPWMEGRLWTPVILLNSPKMTAYTGPARIKNDMGTIIYNGDVVSGQLTGSAYQYDTDGQLVYAGEFRNAKYSGYGSLYAGGRLLYEGNFAENQYSGSGELYDQTGALLYQGSWLGGQRSGQGVEYRADTHTKCYSGSFANGVREGTGVAYEADGVTVRYQGQFSAGLYEGEGTYYEDGVLVYQGQFSRGLFEGAGKLYGPNGNVVYEGGFVQGMRQGEGTVYDITGAELYTGAFLSDSLDCVKYLGSAPEDISTGFGRPGYTWTDEGVYTMIYLGVHTAFLCAADEEGALACDQILMSIEQGFLGLSRNTSLEDAALLLGPRFSSLNLQLTAEQAAAFNRLSLDVPQKGRADKYLMDTYYVKLYYNAAGDKILAVECGSYS